MSKKQTQGEVLDATTQRLTCRLTDEEWADRCRRLAESQADIDQHTDREADVKADLKATRAKLEAERALLARVVRSHEEQRDVRCETTADYARGLAETRRLDTFEVVSTRPLRQDELQGDLGLGAGK